MKPQIFACLGAVLLSTVGLAKMPEIKTARPNQKTQSAPKATELEAYVNLGNIAEGSRTLEPVQALLFALKKCPELDRFRVEWRFDVGPMKSAANVLYPLGASYLLLPTKAERPIRSSAI